MLGLPSVVDYSYGLLDFLLKTRIPLVPTVTETFVRSTFFAQFIPGETAEECLPAMEALRRDNTGSALNYSAEADAITLEGELDIETRRYQEIERALDVQGDFEQRMQAEGWAPGSSAFAVKVSGLIDGNILKRASSALHQTRATAASRIGQEVQDPGFAYEGDGQIISSSATRVSIPDSVLSLLNTGDLEKLQLLWERLDSLAQRAKRNGVKLILDAEETWLNPAIDSYTLLLSMKYNRPTTTRNSSVRSNRPVVYGTYQSYLMRQPAFLKAAIEHAEENGYALGLKVVRGGYITKEKAAGEAKGLPGNGAVWASKPLTDASYNGSVETVLETLKTQLVSGKSLPLSVIFGTHNTDSVQTIIQTLESKGLASRSPNGALSLRKDVEGRVNVAQLYGMRDDLSDVIRSAFAPSKSAISMCFIAYGTLRE
nr:uncharacterized protein CI109_007180 [Kwoniella shandongensis]KAA5524473.1 hypothetical protein CI109_007180 [Kwoniella shandongensis]